MTVTTPRAARGSTRAALVGVVAAVAAPTAIWALASVLGADLTVSFGGDPIAVTVISVVATALVASLVGWGLLALLRRLSRRGRGIWTVLAIVAALASLLGPLTATASTTTKLTLVAMHLAVAIALITSLPRTARP